VEIIIVNEFITKWRYGILTIVINPEDVDRLKVLSEEAERIKEDFELYSSRK